MMLRPAQTIQKKIFALAAAAIAVPHSVAAQTDAGNYISWLYTFGLGLVGLSALIVLVAGGVWYMSAGDNEGRVKQARTWMGNAVYGLVLALVSWLILFTINPDLVRKLNLELTAIKPAPAVQAQLGIGGSCDPAGPASCPPPSICMRLSGTNAECRIPGIPGEGLVCDPTTNQPCPQGTFCRQLGRNSARCEATPTAGSLSKGSQCAGQNDRRCDTNIGLTCQLTYGAENRLNPTRGTDYYTCR